MPKTPKPQNPKTPKPQIKNYGVIKFRTGSDKVKLDYQIDELRKITWIKDKVYFSIEFAKITANIVSLLKQSIG